MAVLAILTILAVLADSGEERHSSYDLLRSTDAVTGDFELSELGVVRNGRKSQS